MVTSGAFVGIAARGIIGNKTTAVDRVTRIVGAGIVVIATQHPG